ncbi:hypothetical protein P171DRAFT_514004 [Karstenula rhodostoma CBS 690.94]|uniref:Ricin B lectin domain-containing protein n=1 Tax=Karstenula rhodostoma CBS 690.94 TaxID=1392251 RepID=A0A9P4UD31_9PLEO|nr:hypothetical protein P171DRAFT_514004 [Karstenula rhodostoma CBS 690.94]
MKFSILLMIAATASAAVVAPRHHKGRKGGNSAAQQGQAAQTGNGATQNAQTGNQATTGGEAATGNNNPAATGGGALARGAATIVLKETLGIPGNECITFRNNGEMVDAACVNTAADRQLQASTVNGQPVLAVQRSFTAGFRQDLVGVDACVGNNGTTFLALPCDDASLDPVTFSNNNLVAASGACQSGHDDAAQITVDQSGRNCAELTSTDTAATPP